MNGAVGSRMSRTWEGQQRQVAFACCPACGWCKAAEELPELERAASVHRLACRWRRPAAVACYTVKAA